MYLSKILIASTVCAALASCTPAVLQLRQTTSCTTPSGAGFCEDTSNTCYGGNFVAGYCPGAANIECCVSPCSTPSGGGNCEYNSSDCSGNFVKGYCPGPNNFICCVTGTTTTSPPPTGTAGFDLSGTPAASFWSCAAANNGVVAIQGYIQGCRIGGEVKDVFVSNYQAAAAANFSRIDAYLFPCTGTQPTGVSCKSPATQVSEFLAAIDDNDMTLGYLWLDIEPTSTTDGDACNAWNLGASANEALAIEWVAALESSQRNWGIYANGNQWTTMFASISTDIGSQLPLWAVQDDFVPGVNTVDTFMGGWTSAVAKQYNLGATLCGQDVDLDSFL